MRRHLPTRRARQRGVATMEVLVFSAVMMMFWLAAEHFAYLWMHVHHLKMEAGNLAYERSIGENAPGSVTLPTDHTASVSSFGQVQDGSDFATQLRQHQPFGQLTYENLLVDPELANQKSGEVGVKLQMQSDGLGSKWAKKRTFEAQAVVAVTPIEPEGIPPNRSEYDWKVAEKIRDALNPFQGF